LEFEKLSKENQNEEITALDAKIEEVAKENDIKDFDFPTHEEYTAFFNEYDEDYALDENGSAESTVESELHNHCGIELEGRKVILEVFPTGFDQE
jgi:hypothetical protein